MHRKSCLIPISILQTWFMAERVPWTTQDQSEMFQVVQSTQTLGHVSHWPKLVGMEIAVCEGAGSSGRLYPYIFTVISIISTNLVYDIEGSLIHPSSARDVSGCSVLGLQRNTHLTIRYVSRYLLHTNDTYRDTRFRLEIISNCMRIILWCSPYFKVCLKWFTVIFLIYL